MTTAAFGIRAKMVLWFSVTISLVLVTAFVLIGHLTREKTYASALSEGYEISRAIAGEVRAELEVSLDSARALSHAFAGVIIQGKADRETFNLSLKNILKENPQFLGAWAAFEPNALDGRDSDFVNTAGHDQTGRFIPYWFRSGDKIDLEPLKDYDVPGAGDYYLLSKNSGQETILEPYMYPVGNKEVLLTSLVAPVIVNGKTIGVVGIDISLDTLSDQLSKVKVLSTGYVNLVSNGGLWSGGTENQAHLGKPITTDGASEFEGALSAIKNGQKYELSRHSRSLDAEVKGIFYPVSIGKTTTPWSVLTSLPTHEIMQSAREIDRILIYSAAAIILVTVLLSVFVSNGIANPIQQITEQMAGLASGRLNITITGKNRQDEIGKMAQTLQVFQESLVRTKELEESQKRTEELAAIEKKRALERLASDFENSVGSVVSQVAAAATQLQANAKNLLSMSEQSSKQTHSVANSTEEASHSVQTVAAAAEELSASIEEINRQISQSGHITSMAVTEVKHTDETVSSLSESATQIGDVIELIQKIAEQTNLLALNATIEAARAGESGKGFAVVASEVKNLATQTAKATDEIASKVVTIQSVSTASVDAIRKIGTIINQMDAITRTITESLRQQDTATREIADNIQRASTGTNNVSQSIAGISHTSQETRNAANDVMSSASNLSSLSEKMRADVHTFLRSVRQG